MENFPMKIRSKLAIILLSITVVTINCRAGTIEKPLGAGDCLKEVSAALRLHSQTAGPLSCWGIGGVNLGMKSTDVRAILGAPLLFYSQKDGTLRYLYIFSRKRTQAPNDPHLFDPLNQLKNIHNYLTIEFDDDRVVALSLGSFNSALSNTLKPADSERLKFYGIGLGTPLHEMLSRFGKPVGWNASHDFFNYWPLPLSYDLNVYNNTIEGNYLSSDIGKYFAASPSGILMNNPDGTLSPTFAF